MRRRPERDRGTDDRDAGTVRTSRRRLLAAGGAAVLVGLAGCAGGGAFETGDGTDDPANDPDDPDDSGGTDAPDDGGDGGGGDGSDDSDDSDGGDLDLDLREANVTGVAIEPGDGDGDEGGEGDPYRFEVTLYHDDDGEDGYANWWQVEAVPGGDRLGRRKLLHAHGTREFTRSATVAVPPDADCVAVRGHDETHGYGGRAVLVSLPDGASVGRRQGSEPAAFEPADCP